MERRRYDGEDSVRAAKTDFILSLVGGAFLSFGYSQRETPFWGPLYVEDGLFEWLTFLGFVLAALVFLVAAYRSVRLGTSAHGSQWLWIVFAIGAAVIAAEEISWGQRVLGWQTPEWLASVNRQGETNVHNLVQIGWYYPYIAVAMTVFMLVARARIRPRAPELYRRAVPPLAQWPSLVFIFVWTVFLHQGEIVEEIASLWAVLFAAYLYRVAGDA